MWNGSVRAYFGIVAGGLSPWRFLPSQEWSVDNSAVLPIRPIVAASKYLNRQHRPIVANTIAKIRRFCRLRRLGQPLQRLGRRLRMDGISLRVDGISLRVDRIPFRVDRIPLCVDRIPLRVDGIPLRVDGIAVRHDGIWITVKFRTKTSLLFCRSHA